MKKLLCLMLAMLMLALVSCGETEETTAKTSTEATTEATTEDAYIEEPEPEEKEPDLIIEKLYGGLFGLDTAKFYIYDGKATLVQCMPGYSENDEIVIPEEVDGYPVVALGRDIPNIKEAASFNIAQNYAIIHPDSFGQPGDNGTLKIHSGIEYISPTAFDMSKIISFNVDSASTHFCDVDGVLYTKDMKTLVRVPVAMDLTIPDSVTEIAPHAFYYWRAEVKPSIEGYYASTYTVEIPKSVEKIGEGAFSALWNGEVETDSENTHFRSVNGDLYTADMKKLIAHNCMDWRDDTYALPDGVEEICSGSFFRCAHGKIVLPDSVLTIDDYAFAGRRAYNYIEIPENVERIGDGAFYSGLTGGTITITLDEKNENFCIVDGNLYTADMSVLLYHMCDGSEGLKLPDGVRKIAAFAFAFEDRSGCQHRKIELPDTVKTIGKYAFRNCELLKNIYMDGVKNIGEYAFVGCRRLEEIVIPDSVTTVKPFSFALYNNVPSCVRIPSSVTKIAKDAFSSTLTHVICEEGSAADLYFKDMDNATVCYAESVISEKSYENRNFGIGTAHYYNDEKTLDFYAASVLLDKNGVIEDCKIKGGTIYEKDFSSDVEFLVPRCIEKIRFENEILGKLDKNDSGESWAYTKLSASYHLYDPNDETKADAVIESMHKNYPITKSGMAIYALTDVSTRELEELEGYILDYTDYTYDDLEYDYQITQYEGSFSSEFAASDTNFNNPKPISYEGKTLDEVKALAAERPEAAAVVNAIENAKATSADKQSDTLEFGLIAKRIIKYDEDNRPESYYLEVAAVGVIADLNLKAVDICSDAIICVPFKDDSIATVRESNDKEWLDTLEKFNREFIGKSYTDAKHLTDSHYPKTLIDAFAQALIWDRRY